MKVFYLLLYSIALRTHLLSTLNLTYYTILDGQIQLVITGEKCVTMLFLKVVIALSVVKFFFHFEAYLKLVLLKSFF